MRFGLFRPGLLLLAGTFACSGGAGAPAGPVPPSDPTQLTFAEELQVDLNAFRRTESGLFVQDVSEGSGRFAGRTSRVWIEYVGWLPDGTVFDGNVGQDSYHFRLGGSEVIDGWNEGIVGMRRGGVRRLVVRPELAYGSRGRGKIPAGSTLVFWVRLVDVD